MYEYLYEHKANVKGRWFGRKLIEVLINEFSHKKEEYFKNAILFGLITVNNIKVNPNYLLKSEDIIYHKIHKHEPNDVIITLSGNFNMDLNSIICLDKNMKEILIKNIKNLPKNTNNNKCIEIITITSDFIVINKPYGIASHPTGGYIKYSVTELLYNTIFKGLRDEKNIKLLKDNRIKLIEENRKNYSIILKENINNLKIKLNNVFKIGCINRLDVVTTGIMILSFNNANKHHQNIGNISIKKKYLAKIKGNFSNKISIEKIKESWNLFFNNKDLEKYHNILNYEKYINYYICFKNINKKGEKMDISNDGKVCITLFKLCKTNDMYSIIECIPITGRTHQIRIHLASLNYPIINDSFYGIHNLSLIHNNNAKCKGYSNLKEEMFIYENCDGENGTACRNKDYFIYLHALNYIIDGIEYFTNLPKWFDLNNKS